MKIYVIIWNLSGKVSIEASFFDKEKAEERIRKMQKEMRQGYYLIHETEVI